MSRKFIKSNAFLKKALEVIPLGSQTFSKSYLQYVKGRAPLFAEKARGAEIWDIDGNKYVDMVSALLPVILGYGYKSVDDAIKKQLKSGIIFSLPAPSEMELARLLREHIPCAEMVRFGKNGSDATTGAIRVARAYTKRDHIAVCGYHGWHDWYIGTTTRDLGVPQATKNLSHKFIYNDIESLKKIFKEFPNQVAAVIMEPMNYVEPKPGFLEAVKNTTHENGAVLIFDEVITGFRFSLGGAQKYFGVTPDLACFGKSMANGMPISALVGKKQYMKVVDDIFYSFTQGGELLSIAAAIATIQEMKKRNVIDSIWRLGEKLQKGTIELLKKNNLDSFIKLGGKPCWQVFLIDGHEPFSAIEIKTYLQQEILEDGFLWYGQHNMSYAHKEKDIQNLLKTYSRVFGKLSLLIQSGKLREHIKGGLITNIFKVR